MTGTSRTNKRNLKNQKSRNPSLTSPPRKYPRKGVNIGRIPQVEPSPDDRHPSSFICKNIVCKATLFMTDAFCKRCSCCICKGFDDDKDASLWLECDEDSCGLSCHLGCALREGNIGVGGLGKLMNRDGCYSCASCGKPSSILGCWKKQLSVAQDGSCLAVLCQRVSLCYQLLEGTQKFQELHEIVKDLKMKLELELDPLNEVSPNMLWSSLSMAAEVQRLLASGIEKADKWLDALSITKLHHTDIKAPEGEESRSSREWDLNIAFRPDLNETPPSDTPMEEDYQLPVRPVMESNDDAVPGGKKVINGRSGSSGVSADGEMPAVNFQGLPPIRAETTNGLPLGKSEESGSLEDKFGGCVKEIRRLECEGYIQTEFREKFLTWFVLRSTEDHKRAVKAFIENFKNDPSSLSGQLVHTFQALVDNHATKA